MAKKRYEHGRRPTNQNQKQDTSKMEPVNRAARRAMASNKATKTVRINQLGKSLNEQGE